MEQERSRDDANRKAQAEPPQGREKGSEARRQMGS